MLKIKLVSRITIVPTFLICQVLLSCIPGFDTIHSIRVRNYTCDTVIIGGSLYNCFDSVDVFLEASNGTAFSSFTSIDESGLLNIHGNLILPDSICRTTYSSLFNHNHTEQYQRAILQILLHSNHQQFQEERDQSQNQPISQELHCLFAQYSIILIDLL